MRNVPSKRGNGRRRRKLWGMPQEKVLLKAGMKRGYVSDFKRATHNPSVRVLGRLTEALGDWPAALPENDAGA